MGKGDANTIQFVILLIGIMAGAVAAILDNARAAGIGVILVGVALALSL